MIYIQSVAKRIDETKTCSKFDCEDEIQGGEGKELPHPANMIFSSGLTF